MTTKRFDPTLKDLVTSYPADWLAQCDLPVSQSVDLIDADLATVTTEADKVLRVHDAQPWLAHIELQASWDGTLPRRVLKYNVLLHDRHNLPVHSIIMLLRPEADSPRLTGTYDYCCPGGLGRVTIDYRVVRVWQKPVAALLAGGLGTLPLAPLSSVTRATLPAVIRRMNERLQAEAEPNQAASLWTATYILMGLRYPADFTAQLLQGVRGMKESVTYQAILEEGKAEGMAAGKAEGMAAGKAEGMAAGKAEGMAAGKAEGMAAGKAEGMAKGSIEEARKVLRRVGEKHLGPPDAGALAALEALADVEQLERLIEQASEARDWRELLAVR